MSTKLLRLIKNSLPDLRKSEKTVGEFILKEILNIQDETNDHRVEFVPPTLGTDYLINQVDTGITDLSTLMRPVSMDLVIDYSKNKKFMPPKATWFEPKPLDGLFFYNILDG